MYTRVGLIGRRAAFWFALPLLGLGVACSSSQDGKLAAEGTGDLQAEPAARSPHALALVEACGDGELTDRGGAQVTRAPYLQAVTSSSASVLLAGDLADGATLLVRTPAGDPVATVPARADGRGLLSARVADLAPDTVYCYSLDGISDPTGFRTAPEPGSDSAVRFVAFGDSGSASDGQYALLAQMEDLPFDLVVHTGDVAYDSGTDAQLQRTFFDVYAPVLRHTAAYPIAGNHDYETRSAAPLREAFELPDNGVAGQSERYFSFDWGAVHFVGLDTERLTDEQVSWLQADLKANKQPFTVVYGHHPAFSSGQHGSSKSVQKKLVPLFARYHVSLVLSGHDHHYERSRPIDGVTYVVTGGGGRGTRPTKSSDFTAFAEDVLHFVYVEVEDDTLTLHAIDGVGREFDSAVLHAQR